MGPLKGMYRPKFRTPGFAPEGLVDDEYQRSPVPTAAEARYTPMPEPEASFDSAHSMAGEYAAEAEPPPDPGPQRLNLRGELDNVKRAPTAPKVSGIRNVLGTLAGLYVPDIGESIKRPGYADKVREFQQERQYNADRLGAAGKIATAEAAGARAEAERSRGKTQEALRTKAETETGQIGKKPILANKGQRVVSPDGTKVLLEADDDDDFIEVTPESAKKLGITGTKIPRTQLSALAQLNKPEATPAEVKAIEAEVMGANPTFTPEQKSAAVAKILGEGRKAKGGLIDAQTKRALRPPKSDAAASAGGPLSSAASAVKRNPVLFDSYTPTQRGKILDDLEAHGETDIVAKLGGKTLSHSGVSLIADGESAVETLGNLQKSFKAAEQYVGPVAGLQKLNPYSDARILQAEIDKVKQNVGKLMEGGVLRKEDEAKYTRILATINDTPRTAAAKIDGIIKEIKMKTDAYKRTAKNAGYKMGGFEASGGDEPKANQKDPLGIR